MVQGTITMVTWGKVDSQEVMKFTLRNKCGQEVDVVTYGATVTAIKTLDKHGNIEDIVLGFNNVEGTFIQINLKDPLF